MLQFLHSIAMVYDLFFHWKQCGMTFVHEKTLIKHIVNLLSSSPHREKDPTHPKLDPAPQISPFYQLQSIILWSQYKCTILLPSPDLLPSPFSPPHNVISLTIHVSAIVVNRNKDLSNRLATISHSLFTGQVYNTPSPPPVPPTSFFNQRFFCVWS